MEVSVEKTILNDLTEKEEDGKDVACQNNKITLGAGAGAGAGRASRSGGTSRGGGSRRVHAIGDN